MVDIDDRIRLLAEECQDSYLAIFMDKDEQTLTDVGKLRAIEKKGNQYWLIFDHEELDVTCFFDIVAIFKRLPIRS
jgi:hypothetical protein